MSAIQLAAVLTRSGKAAADLLFSSLKDPSVRACCTMIRGYAKVCSDFYAELHYVFFLMVLSIPRVCTDPGKSWN